LDPYSQSSFAQVGQILAFTAKTQIPLTEAHVRRHVAYFKGLLEQLA
jgi:hypothetical protein